MPSSLQMCPFRSDRGRHGIITTNANSHDKTPAKDPSHLQVRGRNAVWQGYDHDGADYANYELVTIHEAAAINVAEIAEAELADDVPHIGGAVDDATK